MNALLKQFVLVSLCIAVLQGCAKESIVGDVLKQNARADGHASALITRDSGGATTSFVYRVYIRDDHGHASELLRADHVVGLSAKWNGSALQIGMTCGRIFQFSNFNDVLGENGSLKDVIHVTLQNGGLCSDGEYRAGSELAR